MSYEMSFQVFHKYNRLVRRGQAAPLACGRCNQELVLRLGPEDQPALDCMFCNSRILPGMAMYDGILAQVQEFFIQP